MDDMADIVVTTPKTRMEEAAKEAQACIAAGGGFYFRVFKGNGYPRKVRPGDRVFYVEDGYLRGFCTVVAVDKGIEGQPQVCDTTGNVWYGHMRITMDAKTWKWVKPIPIKGFRGWYYFTPTSEPVVIGDWLDSKPPVS